MPNFFKSFPVEPYTERFHFMIDSETSTKIMHKPLLHASAAQALQSFLAFDGLSQLVMYAGCQMGPTPLSLCNAGSTCTYHALHVSLLSLIAR